MVPGKEPAAPPTPPTPSAPKAAPNLNLGGSAGPGDRNALLSQIRGGKTLRKATTNDRSGAQSAGAVVGSASPPRGASLASVPPPEPPAPPAPAEEDSGDEYEPPEDLDAGPDVPGAFVDAPAEPAAAAREDGPVAPEPTAAPAPAAPVPEPEPAGAAAAPAAGGAGDPALDLGFDPSRSFAFRTVYPYEDTTGEGLSFPPNVVLTIHPTLDGPVIQGDWTYGAIASDPTHKGLIPVTYIASMENGTCCRSRVHPANPPSHTGQGCIRLRGGIPG